MTKQSKLTGFPIQGSVYNKIIEEVIENCHVAFEEEGVEPAALEELRKVSILIFGIPALATHSSLCYNILF